MALKQFDDMFPLVKPYVPGCPDVTIEDHLAEAARDFCVRSEIWRYNTDEDSTINGEDLFELDIPSGALLEDILAIKVNGRTLKRVSDKFVENFDEDVGQPSWYSLVDEKYVKLYPIPDATYAVKAKVVLKPTLRAKGIEDFIYNHHGRTIAYGAIALLAAIPSKEWTDPGLAALMNAKFDKETDAAKARDYRKVPVRVRPRPFA